MKSWKGARFVGLYASFPIEKYVQRTRILVELLGLEQSLDFNTMKFGRLSKGVRKTRFTNERLSEVLKSLETGENDRLQLYSSPSDNDWIKAQENQTLLSWKSSVIEPINRPPSPVDKRFGSAGSVVATYPLSRFEVDSESPFELKLLQLVKRLSREQNLNWAFVHEGFRPKRPLSVGEDDIFQETREKFPLTSFDADLDIAVFFKEFVKGAFWANFLNPTHVERLGGLERIIENRPSPIVEEIGQERVLLRMGASPLLADYDKAAHDYQRLREFLRPILLETPEDRQKFQMEVLGSWRPPGYVQIGRKCRLNRRIVVASPGPRSRMRCPRPEQDDERDRKAFICRLTRKRMRCSR